MIVTAAQIRAARALLGWSQVKMAVRAGVAHIRISQFETGNRIPSSGFVDAPRRALEAGGVEFVDGGLEVRLKAR
jgi:transcriptional regulator with XRE-family HTH domain